MERRSAVRYPIVLNARYQTLKKRTKQQCGFGRTVNISSGGFLIATDHDFIVGVRLEVIVEWPALLDGTVELVLVANGRVVRAPESSFALELSGYEFRTARRRLKSSAAAAGYYAAATGSAGSEASAVPTATARFRVPD